LRGVADLAHLLNGPPSPGPWPAGACGGAPVALRGARFGPGWGASRSGGAVRACRVDRGERQAAVWSNNGSGGGRPTVVASGADDRAARGRRGRVLGAGRGPLAWTRVAILTVLWARIPSPHQVWAPAKVSNRVRSKP